MNDSLYSSKYHKWETPPDIFNELDSEFRFTLDPCCIPETAKCDKYYTPKEDGLSKDWAGETVFCNPPYGRVIGDWVKKCHDEAKKSNTKVVMLIPSRTDTSYFHDYIYGIAEIRFLRGRIKFLKDGKEINSAPFPSMVVVYD